MYYIFGFNCCVPEIEIEKSGMLVWQKDSSSKKRALDSELRNFLVKRLYRQC